MEPSFEKLLVLLAGRGVRFIVVGGVAGTLQGYVRLTEDVDLLVEPTATNIQLLLAALSGWGEGFTDVLIDADALILDGHARRYASKASLIGWKGPSMREKVRLHAMALKELMENPHAFD